MITKKKCCRDSEWGIYWLNLAFCAELTATGGLVTQYHLSVSAKCVYFLIYLILYDFKYIHSPESVWRDKSGGLNLSSNHIYKKLLTRWLLGPAGRPYTAFKYLMRVHKNKWMKWIPGCFHSNFFFGNLSAGIKILRVKRDADGWSGDVIFHNLSFHNTPPPPPRPLNLPCYHDTGLQKLKKKK